MAPIKGILFDLDQTLLDRTRSLDGFLNWQWHNHVALQSRPFQFFKQGFLRLDDNGRIWKDKVYQELLGYSENPGVTAPHLLQEYLDELPLHSQLFPGVRTVLSEFKSQSLKLGIITNGREDLQSAIIQSCGLQEIMETIVISEAVGLRKPDPAIFHTALENLSLPPEACVFIGDNPTADIQGAHKVGMKTIWKHNTVFPPPEKPTTSAIFRNFKELPALIRGLNEAG